MRFDIQFVSLSKYNPPHVNSFDSRDFIPFSLFLTFSFSFYSPHEKTTLPSPYPFTIDWIQSRSSPVIPFASLIPLFSRENSTPLLSVSRSSPARQEQCAAVGTGRPLLRLRPLHPTVRASCGRRWLAGMAMPLERMCLPMQAYFLSSAGLGWQWAWQWSLVK